MPPPQTKGSIGPSLLETKSATAPPESPAPRSPARTLAAVLASPANAEDNHPERSSGTAAENPQTMYSPTNTAPAKPRTSSHRKKSLSPPPQPSPSTAHSAIPPPPHPQPSFRSTA